MSSNQAITFSPKEMQNLALAWQCMETEPKIDYEKFGRLAGYTKGSASVTIGNLKRKLRTHTGALNGSPITTPSTPKTPKTPKSSSKRAAPGTSADATPSKKSRNTSAKGKNAHLGADIMNEDDEEEFKNVKVKSEEVAALGEDAQSFWDQSATFGQSAHHQMAGAAAGYGGGDIEHDDANGAGGDQFQYEG
ncbi:hypothetical protein BCR34DRAFT_591575 [Clohesyomyces aquaticus]|uniref:Uncharacterized protein n=1 Tax=Clohesyomyces aquaticus TaxID=1231657 RepID=A0A1Y1Z102_9PLEO|nr:hypothetical protein BCR34DRAFT_591575 [Clohesyomyces aquaticus]